MKKVLFCVALAFSVFLFASCVTEDGFYIGPSITDKYGTPIEQW